MTPSDLVTDKLYVVTRDVENQDPDRRVRYSTFSTRTIIEKGTLVRADRHPHLVQQAATYGIPEQDVKPILRGVTYGGNIDPGTAIYGRLIECLEPAEETVATLTLRRGEGMPRSVLAWMVTKGLLTVERIEAIADEMDAYYDRDTGVDNTPPEITVQLTPYVVDR